MTETKPIPIPAYVRGVKTLVDGGRVIDFETPELSAEASTYIFSLHRKNGFLIFMENAVKAEDIDLPESAPEFRNDKTPSQRLRGVLYRVWEQMPQGKPKTFDEFYKQKMEELISHFKEKLS